MEYYEESVKVMEEADLLHSEQEVEQVLDRMAAQITEALGDDNPAVICVLSGAIIPMGMLLPRLNFPLTIDYLHATRYGNKTSGGELDWVAEPVKPLQGRVVLLIDDILDEGATLAAIIEHCREAGAKAVYSAVLIEKIRERSHQVEADFVGLKVVDRYLFGYGMDYKGYLRNAPGIYAVKDM